MKNLLYLNSRYTWLGVIIVALILSGCLAQKMKKGESLSASQKVKVGDHLFEQGSYYNALDYYMEAHQQKPQDLYITKQIAETYYQSRDYKNAEKWYKKVVEADASKYPLARYKYAQNLMHNQKYKKAKKVFDNFLVTYSGKEQAKYQQLAQTGKKSCDFAQKNRKNPKKVKINHLGRSVNAPYTDYAPLPRGDTLYFSSLRADSVIELGEKKKTYVSQIYQAEESNGQFQNRKSLPPVINKKNVHTGNSAFSLNGKRFYFTRCQTKENTVNEVNCNIYVSQYKNGKWQKAEKLGDNINSPEYSSTHPAIGESKRGWEMLYFAANAPDSRGGFDIYYARITKRGRHLGARNAGRDINTIQHEKTPYYNTKTRTLYYSSNGKVGLGGYDLYKATGSGRRWRDVQNLGYPLNSSADDMYYVPTPDQKGGYLVSNRPGAIALKSPTCCDDIFRFQWKRKKYFAVKGHVYDEADTTRKHPLDSAIVTLYLADKKRQQDTTKELITIATANTGDGENYFFDLQPDKTYKLSASKDGYFSGQQMFKEYKTLSTKGLESSDTLQQDLLLKKMEKNVAYQLQNIYYDFDKATLRDRSEETLDSMVMLLQQHPAIKVEISSHTDSIGNDAYNKRLSQRRAESVVEYLVEQGIQKKRLVPKGYGETKPIAPNTNPDGTDNPEGRQKNRRTEFKIIGELENVEYRKPGQEKYYEDYEEKDYN